MAVKASAHITLSFVVDVEAYYRYYLLQSSTLTKPSKPTTNPPSDSWTDSEPSYTEGSTNSLYFVDLTVFSDGTWSYSEVSLSSSYEAAKEAYNKAVAAQNSVTTLTTRVTNAETAIESNTEQIELRATKTEVTTIVTEAVADIEIGGRNLAVGSAANYAYTGFNLPESTVAGADDYTLTAEIYNTTTVARWSGSATSASSGPFFECSTILGVTLEVGNVYTMSAWVKADAETTLEASTLTDGQTVISSRVDVGTEWSRIWVTFEAVNEDGNFCFYTAANATADAPYIYMCGIKLEKGNKATDWSPAPDTVELELAKNYYTKQETDAQIQVASNAVTISVGETVSSVETSLTESINDTNTVLDTVRSDVADLENEQSAQADTIGSISTRVTNVETLADGFNIRIETAERNFVSIDGSIQAEVEARETLIRAYDDGDFQGVEIGVSDSPFVTRLSNEELGFYEDGTKVAYIGNKKMYITDADVENSLRIGNFVFKPHGDGNLALMYVEDE